MPSLADYLNMRNFAYAPSDGIAYDGYKSQDSQSIGGFTATTFVRRMIMWRGACVVRGKPACIMNSWNSVMGLMDLSRGRLR